MGSSCINFVPFHAHLSCHFCFFSHTHAILIYVFSFHYTFSCLPGDLCVVFNYYYYFFFVWFRAVMTFLHQGIYSVHCQSS